MTDDQHGEATPQGGGRWDPLPQGDYDDGATAFVKLPEGGIDALLSGDSPLAAPGHGYVPPRIAATHADGAAVWPVPDAGGQWPGPDAGAAPHTADDRFTYQREATQQWAYEEPAAPAAPGHDVTGQWSIPVAGGHLPDESGEFTASALAGQWGGAPATLPGGAPAPWATDGAGHAWDAPGHIDAGAPQAYAPATGYGHPAPDQGGTGDTGHGYPAPGHAEPGHLQPGHAEPGHLQPGHAEPGHVENADAEAGHAEGVHGQAGHVEPGHAEGAHAQPGHVELGHADAVHAQPGYAEAGHAEGARAQPGHVEPGHAEGAHAQPGHADSGHADAGHGGAEHADDAGATDAGHPEDVLPDAGHAEGGLPDAGYFGTGHADTGHPEDVLLDAGHTEGGLPAAGHAESEHAHAGHADAGDGDAPGAVDAPGGADAPGVAAASGEPVAPAHPQTGPGVAPEAEVHALADAPERPAEAPAGHDRPSGPADASGSATAATTAAEAPQDPDAPAAPTAAPEPAVAEPDESAVAAVPEDAEPAPEAEAATEAEAEAEAAGVAAAVSEDGGEPAAAPLAPHDDHPLASYVLRVNGADRPVTDAWIGESLLYVLRERLGLAGAKDGCSQGECGACNVQVDGRLVASCLVPAVTTAGSEVRTVEGLAVDGQPSDVQRALARCGAVQCGFCVPGMAMTVHDLLEGNPAPSELEARQALCGNLCRCSGYRGVLEAVKEVVAEREASHGGGGADGDEARIPHQAAPGSGGVHPSAFEAPGAFAAPRSREPYEAPGPYQAPGPYDAPDPYGTPPGPIDEHPGAQDQHYGQDGGQA
ncbi:2Fe-2S iron-sulfur cluster-binding protein [Streptomyces sp. NPDC051132]|uniref:2Fe-2S iron-sulfur cluster-binding protein n=1 Tax=unclassified Streptomyces TaxID=2593676 RepID=UPI003422D46E